MARIFVDAHVHFHERDTARDVIEHALQRAEALGGRLALLFADPLGESGFSRFQEAASASAFTLENTGEAESFVLRHAKEQLAGGLGHDVAVCRGRQWVSREGIEVLHLLAPLDTSEASLERERLPLDQLLAALSPRTGVVVLPWGFGKWLGRRRSLLRVEGRKALASGSTLFSGDIRARCWPWSSPLRTLPELRVLPGADPLPLPGGFREIGRYVFSTDVDPEQPPAAALRGALAGDAELHVAGGRQSLLAAIAGQLRYRWYRRR
ncbi:MAG: hypothetical protein HKP27_12205 [Myxococcales bacterium]|nr:hypothetical protein [Myxococcales bacterium]